MTTVLTILFWLLVASVLFTTLAPLSNSAQWWVRAWDFPRLHICAVAIMAIIIGLIISGPIALVAACLMLLCAGYQGYRIYPYTTLASPEIMLNKSVPEDQQVLLLSANVLMENDDHEALQLIIERENPDILFLMETDPVWEAALERQLDRYDTVIREPLENHYGLIFATSLTVIEAKAVFLSDDKTPSVLAELEGPGGRFFFVGLHPRPPVPGNTTEERDEQILRAASLADHTYLPVVAMGDFNDTAWSWTAERFKHHGKFRDPRIGRGMLPSFDATSRWMRFPIDQLYLTEGLNLISYDRLEAFGSDHFPIKATIAVKQ